MLSRRHFLCVFYLVLYTSLSSLSLSQSDKAFAAALVGCDKTGSASSSEARALRFAAAAAAHCVTVTPFGFDSIFLPLPLTLFSPSPHSPLTIYLLWAMVFLLKLNHVILRCLFIFHKHTHAH